MIDEPFCYWHSPATAEEAAEARRPGGFHRRKKKFPTIRGLRMGHVIQMLALQEARQRAESLYLAGSASLFPDGSRRWDAILHDMQQAAVMTDRLVELDGGVAIEDQETIPAAEQIDGCLADLVEVARIKTLDDLGEGHAAFDRTRRWLATKESGPTSN